MTTWDERKAVGDQHEVRTAEELAIRGWAVDFWGQGALTERVSATLRRTDSALRWAPDLIAALGSTLVLIDCKSRMAPSGRHAVSRASLKAHRGFASLFDLPLCYVFEDLTVLTPDEVVMLGQPGPHSRLGSGGAYLLVETSAGRPFNDVFGARPTADHLVPAA